MRIGAYLYPWDVDGDPAAADRIAGLGLTEITLAAAYHAVRAVTPFHPRHRIVTRDAAVYYQPDPARWDGWRLRPRPADASAGQPDPAGSFGRAAAALRAAGISVTAWVVVTHNGRLAATGECAVRNAFGDVYPWALCAGSAAVRAYASALAAEVAALAGVDAVELEACGWYGFEHGSAHDKTAGVAGLAGPAGAWGLPLLSLCFCAECGHAYRAAGADPAKLAAQVRAAADGTAPLPEDAAAVLGRTREAASARLLTDVLAAARAAAPGRDVLVHSAPDPHAVGANPGYDPAVLCGPHGADGIVLACGNPASAPGPGRPHGGRRAARHPDRRRPAGRGGPGRRPGHPARPGRGGVLRRRNRAAPLPRRPGRTGRPRIDPGVLPGPVFQLARLVGAVAGQLEPQPGDIVLVVMVPAVLADAAVSLESGAGAFGARPRSGPRWPAFGTHSHGAAVPSP